ncbi:restriction endonuclease subunit S [Aggregatibacter actinomycetemcomitans]|uniref:restriction endonuclease subunit S n=1 Tax=Aggregatibacter actinomycetemcomitans TaxID=714 RepID=UPI00197BEE5A|nr:restriction endonuclease subunit S [Aggregatibacter actinomycetemcomitans]MBN6074584.1 restriction endonuclease subunit S [Aggregatibacter actinomycetemcomitans]
MKNNRTFLDKLLDGAEVKWKPLEQVVHIANNARKPVKSSLRVAGNIPYYGANNIQDYVEGYTHDGEFVLIAEDGSASLENYSIQWAVGKFWTNNHVHVICSKEELNNRFLYHYLTNMNFIPFLAGKERAKLTKAKLQQIPIPIPPLPVQTEIVRILDALTALTSELTSELNLRQKQYQYYLDSLLEFSNEITFKSISDIFHLRNGYTPSKSIKEYWENGLVPWFRMEDIRENGRILNSSLQTVSKNAVKGGKFFPANSIIVATSATIGEHALITVPFLANQRFTVLSLKQEYIEKFNIYFLYYYCFLLDEWCNKNTTMSSFASVDMNGFKSFPIPMPPLEVQNRIVSILDKFETLTNSITEGLPLAIEQSQKRYEYYRELLLNF